MQRPLSAFKHDVIRSGINVRFNTFLSLLSSSPKISEVYQAHQSLVTDVLKYSTMATAPEATGWELPITEQPGSLDAILQSLGLDQLNPPTPTGGSAENVELRGLTPSIEALAQDVANKFGTLDERLNALRIVHWHHRCKIATGQSHLAPPHPRQRREDPASCRSLVSHRAAKPMTRSGYHGQRDPWTRYQITNKCSPGMTRMMMPHQLTQSCLLIRSNRQASAGLLQKGSPQHH